MPRKRANREGTISYHGGKKLWERMSTLAAIRANGDSFYCQQADGGWHSEVTVQVDGLDEQKARVVAYAS